MDVTGATKTPVARVLPWVAALACASAFAVPLAAGCHTLGTDRTRDAVSADDAGAPADATTDAAEQDADCDATSDGAPAADAGGELDQGDTPIDVPGEAGADACDAGGDVIGDAPPEAGVDASSDGASDAAMDASADAPGDVPGDDAGDEAGDEAGQDAAQDSGQDGGQDASGGDILDASAGEGGAMTWFVTWYYGITGRENGGAGQQLTIHAGDSVVWVSTDGHPHTATSTSGPTSFDTGTFSTQSSPVAFPSVGTWTYDCTLHGAGSMSGTLTVQ